MVTARALEDESGMIITLMGMHNRSVMVAMLGTPCAIPPRNSKRNGNFRLNILQLSC
jgi:hypothetical protein